jgi:hypothetical protein
MIRPIEAIHLFHADRPKKGPDGREDLEDFERRPAGRGTVFGGGVPRDKK